MCSKLSGGSEYIKLLDLLFLVLAELILYEEDLLGCGRSGFANVALSGWRIREDSLAVA